MSMKTPTRGFTLIETLVAVTILTFAVVGPMVTASRAIVAVESARDHLTASYLAQEGVEYVRAARDDQFLSHVLAEDPEGAWEAFLEDANGMAQCRETACALGAIQNDGTPELIFSNTAATFQLGNDDDHGEATNFNRTIQLVDPSVSPVPVPDDIRVVSTVTWQFHGKTYTVSATNHLTPWQ
jgi:prepilin-type N-terminal cleavage/methylation domain-containing protein